MDVIKPDLLWIGTRCYRVNQTTNMSSLVNSQKPEKYIEQNDFDDFDAGPEDEETENYQIESVNGRYSTSFHIPSQLFGQIIGAKGATRRRIETETSSQIQVPKQGNEGDIKITSNNPKNVSAARRHIEIIVIGARAKLDFTHFLSVPMVDPVIQKAFQDFKGKVTSDPQIFGISEECFQNPSRLHVTIASMTLLDNADRTQAAKCLQECQEVIVNRILQESGPMEVEMRGLEIMNDDPTAVNVLYGSVSCEPLQVMSNQIYEYFVNKGMTQKKFDRVNVKLHVTLMNTKFTRHRDDPKEKGLKNFDAMKILEKYGDFHFGKVRIKEIHLSQRYTGGSNGYYEASCIIKV